MASSPTRSAPPENLDRRSPPDRWIVCCAALRWSEDPWDAASSKMALTYFKRYRMEADLGQLRFPEFDPVAGCAFHPWREEWLEAHADAKYRSFRREIDANVFPCLGDREGCARLMRDIASRTNFVPEAAWLLRRTDDDGRILNCGTVQGVLDNSGAGAVQNLGVVADLRGKGLGTRLLQLALEGFRSAGLRRAFLEVTAQNVGAVRLYQRLGFRTIKTVYKAAQVAVAT